MERVVVDRKNGDQMVSWNSWDDQPGQPVTVEDHIEQYRKSLVKLRTANEESVQEPDFFNVNSINFLDCFPDICLTFFIIIRT